MKIFALREKTVISQEIYSLVCIKYHLVQIILFNVIRLNLGIPYSFHEHNNFRGIMITKLFIIISFMKSIHPVII